MTAPGSLQAPSLARRLACFVYEGVLLFGVLVLADYLFSSLTQQRHALTNRHAGMAFLFVVLGIYFIWFWTHGGQTLAQKTWRLRLLDARGASVGQWRALARYFASWVWFLPPLVIVDLIGTQRIGAGSSLLFVLLYVLAYAGSCLLRNDRQFWHDVVCGTRLVSADTSRHAG